MTAEKIKDNCIIEKHYHEISSHLENELNKSEEDRNFEAILFLIKRSAKLIARLTGKTENQIHMDLTEKLKEGNEKVAGTIGHGWNITVTVLTSLVQVAGGCIGAAGVGYAFKGVAETAKVLGKAGSVVGAAGQGFQGFKGLSDEIQNNKRTKHQHETDETKRIRDQRMDSQRKAQQSGDELLRSLEQQDSARHDIVSKIWN